MSYLRNHQRWLERELSHATSLLKRLCKAREAGDQEQIDFLIRRALASIQEASAHARILVSLYKPPAAPSKRSLWQRIKHSLGAKRE